MGFEGHYWFSFEASFVPQILLISTRARLFSPRSENLSPIVASLSDKVTQQRPDKVKAALK